MKKGIILYQSKYGATKKYANWLSQATGFEMIETPKASIEHVRKFDIVIVGGGVYASGIAGLSFVRKNMVALKEKQVLVFCVAASPYDEDTFREVKKHNLKGELEALPCIYMRGAFHLKEMNLFDRNLCKLLRKTIKKKSPDQYEPWEKALMEVGDSNCDWTDITYIEPILEWLK